MKEMSILNDLKFIKRDKLFSFMKSKEFCLWEDWVQMNLYLQSEALFSPCPSFDF